MTQQCLLSDVGDGDTAVAVETTMKSSDPETKFTGGVGWGKGGQSICLYKPPGEWPNEDNDCFGSGRLCNFSPALSVPGTLYNILNSRISRIPVEFRGPL